jgi:hypothetical protein
MTESKFETIEFRSLPIRIEADQSSKIRNPIRLGGNRFAIAELDRENNLEKMKKEL